MAEHSAIPEQPGGPTSTGFEPDGRDAPTSVSPASGGHIRRRSLGLWIAGAALFLGGGAGGYLLGTPPSGAVDRAVEAAGDLAVPVTRALDRRARADRLRGETRRFLEGQRWFFQENGRIRQPAEVPSREDGFQVRYVPDVRDAAWVADLRYADPRFGGVTCAVAVGRIPAYVAGIPLRRDGEVRCSGDLATRLNRLWARLVPVNPR